jgi:hypothetical protein
MNAQVDTSAQEATDVAPAKPAREVRTVTMTDGRQVDFGAKARMLKEIVHTEGLLPAIRLDFSNGETRLFTIPSTLVHQFAGHGAAQKLGDETAGEKDVEDAILAVDALIERLNKGEWNVARAPGSGMSGTSVLLRALVEASGKSIEAIKPWLMVRSQPERLALRQSPDIKPIVDRIEAEKAAGQVGKIDTAALLASLG